MLHSIHPQRAIAVFLLLILFSNIPTVLAGVEGSTNLPTRSNLRYKLDELNKQKELSEREKLEQQDLVETLETLDKIECIKDEITKLNQKVVQAPVKMRQAIKGINTLNDLDNDKKTRETLENLSLRQLESRVSKVLDELQTAQSDLVTYNSQLISLQMQPERAQNEMYEASQQLQEIRNRLNSASVGESILRPSLKTLLLAKQSFLNTKIDQQRKSLESNTILKDTLKNQRDYVTANTDRLEHQLQLLLEAVNSKRLILIKKTAQESILPDEILHIQTHPLIRQQLDINHHLGHRLMQVTEEGNKLVQKEIRVKNWLERALQSERSIKEQIALLKGSLLLSRILYQQQQTFPSPDELEDMTSRIANLRLEQFEINQKRDALFQNDVFITKLEESYSAKVHDEVHDALLQVLDMRRELLDQLSKQLGNQLMIAINLQIKQQQLVSVSKSLQEILTQQIFWVNSNKPIDWEWIKVFPSALKDQIKEIRITVNWRTPSTAMAIILLVGVPFLVIIGLARWRLNWLREHQKKLALEVGKLHHDSQLHTPKAILIDLIHVIPVALLILGTGLILLIMQLNISDLLWAFSKKLAVFWLVFSLCWRILQKDGVASCHFSIPRELANYWRQQIIRISLSLLPLHFWSVMSELSPLHLMDDVIGQFVILVNLFVLTVLMWPMLRGSWRDKKSNTFRLATVTILSIVPISLMALTVSGYLYTTLRLTGRWIETVYLIIFWNLLYQTVLRGLSVAARRIVYRCALIRRQDFIKEGTGLLGETEEEPSIALEQVNQQTLRLTKLVLISLFSIAFWAIWSDLITVFSYLDSIVLWHYSGSSAGGTVLKDVTMSSLLFAIISSVVAWALIRNLPGLLEVLVLSRLKLRQGASYAITTILNYIIIIAGGVIVFSSLGVSWDKLQWLAAALSVGLGFGLQEIFGNFVSGLIILFERPVRIGDTVTIGSFSGTVSKIRIRATTITDFDRKEVIIPNKAFVTERLINWSLSDTVTRVVIRIGVAYGSDLDKVKEVLLKIASDHPKVMDDPAPTVFFTTFGSSTLEHELRLYVHELRDRTYTVDELNRRIDCLFRQNNINIAFNQLEVHLSNQR